jgi:hypothetical protein
MMEIEMCNLNIRTKSHEACKLKFLKFNQIEIYRKWDKYKGPQMAYHVVE